MTSARRIDAAGGFTAAVTSACQFGLSKLLPPCAEASLEPVTEDRVDRGVVRIGNRIEQRMRGRRRSEGAREPQMVVVRDELVAEEHDLPLQQRGADLGDMVVAQWRGEVDSAGSRLRSNRIAGGRPVLWSPVSSS